MGTFTTSAIPSAFVEIAEDLNVTVQRTSYLTSLAIAILGGALGSAVVAESFFKRDRGRCMGVWALMVTLGVPGAPFIFGFVALRVGYRWIYWILAIVGVYPAADGVG
jgi:MFS family permease